MTDIVLTKAAGGVLVPVDQQAAEYIAKLKLGGGITASVKHKRNVKFHRKLFKLFDYAFDMWEPTEKIYKGQVVAKNPEQFRNDITILAGFYETTINLKGEVRLVAKSISFAGMKQDEFDKLYNRVVDVVLQRVLTTYDREELDAVMDRLIGFL